MRSISFLLCALVGVLAAGGCASSVATPAQLASIKITTNDDTTLDVVCEGRVVYRIETEAGSPVDFPFEEGRCELRSKEPVRLTADVQFR